MNVLWVGEAAYPLHNITRVHTFLLKPDRMAAFVSFLKWVGVCGVLFVLLALANDESSSSSYDDYDSGDSGNADSMVTLAVIVLIVLVVDLIRKWSAPTEHVLAIETASASSALVTLPQREQIPALRDALVEAIKNPATGMTFYAHSVSVDAKRYHNGDNVNIAGGKNNTGVRK
ncbi:hypothetical protein GUY60_37905 [Streptomyces sp. YC537]|uniref:Uncharacterized protein n=1 Tax=Streptomyces boluensis TaxID=1775135 RepID=A0A964UYK1_9ACTN|nr:hypothetical protein [Streptomyces boluensis]